MIRGVEATDTVPQAIRIMNFTTSAECQVA
jgi:hypothetical protein